MCEKFQSIFKQDSNSPRTCGLCIRFSQGCHLSLAEARRQQDYQTKIPRKQRRFLNSDNGQRSNQS